MINVKKEGIILQKTDFEFENEGVLNPAILREGDSIFHLRFSEITGIGSRIANIYCKG